MIDRIKKLYESEGYNTSSFAKKIGVRQSTIYMAEKRSETGDATAYSMSTLNKILDTFPHWSKAEILSKDTPVAIDVNINKEENGILKPHNYRNVPFFKEVDAVFRMSGLSMYPLIKPGDVVVCKQLKDTTFLPYGELYYILTKTDKHHLVRYLHKYQDRSYYLLKSYNKDKFPDQKLKKSEVNTIFSVLGGAFQL